MSGGGGDDDDDDADDDDDDDDDDDGGFGQARVPHRGSAPHPRPRPLCAPGMLNLCATFGGLLLAPAHV